MVAPTEVDNCVMELDAFEGVMDGAGKWDTE